MKPTTVYALVIDSDRQSSGEVAELLRMEGYETREEPDGARAFREVMERKPDVIVMADEMPGPEGAELLPALRAVTDAPLLVIGDGSETAVVTALLQGADAYLHRPINRRELVLRVRALLQRYQSGREDF